MAPASITAGSSGTTTPTTGTELTNAGIKHSMAQKNGFSGDLAPLDVNLLIKDITKSPRAVPEPGSAEANSSRVCTDHMVTAKWTSDKGWEAPELKPYGE